MQYVQGDVAATLPDLLRLSKSTDGLSAGGMGVQGFMRFCGTLACSADTSKSDGAGAALFKDGGIGASWGSVFDVTDQFLRASLLFSAAGCFRLVTQTEGRDIKHLLDVSPGIAHTHLPAQASNARYC